MNTNSDVDLRTRLAEMLGNGLPTDWQNRAYTTPDIKALTGKLQLLERQDYAGKLAMAGFTLKPYDLPGGDIVQACRTCIYYVPHRRFCALPELRLPVEPEWSCVLWRA